MLDNSFLIKAQAIRHGSFEAYPQKLEGISTPKREAVLEMEFFGILNNQMAGHVGASQGLRAFGNQGLGFRASLQGS